MRSSRAHALTPAAGCAWGKRRPANGGVGQCACPLAWAVWLPSRRSVAVIAMHASHHHCHSGGAYDSKH
jgi:hypothetical protein